MGFEGVGHEKKMVIEGGNPKNIRERGGRGAVRRNIMVKL